MLYAKSTLDRGTNQNLNIAELLPREVLERTEPDAIKLTKEEVEKFTARPDIQESEGIGFKQLERETAGFPQAVSTKAYIEYKTAQLVTQVNRELEEWESFGTEESLINISNIKELIQEQKANFSQEAEQRIFTSLLSLIFRNNKWEELSTSQVRGFKGELSRFATGVIKLEDLKVFSRHLSNLKISPINIISDDEEEKEGQKEKSPKK